MSEHETLCAARDLVASERKLHLDLAHESEKRRDTRGSTYHRNVALGLGKALGIIDDLARNGG